MRRYLMGMLASALLLAGSPAMAGDMAEVDPEAGLGEAGPGQTAPYLEVDHWVARCVEICAPNPESGDGGWHECCRAGCRGYMENFLGLKDRLDAATACIDAAMNAAAPCIPPPMSLCSWMWKYVCQSARDTAGEYCRHSLGLE